MLLFNDLLHSDNYTPTYPPIASPFALPLQQILLDSSRNSYTKTKTAPAHSGRKRLAQQDNCQDHHYCTFTLTPSECVVNSGAYMHCSVATPQEKSPLWLTTNGYSNTWVPRGK